jgi:hypothetical protein
MVRTFLKAYMELGSYFLFLQEQIKDIIIIRAARSSKRISTPHTQSAPRSVLHQYTPTRPFGDALYHNDVTGAKVPTRLSAHHTCLNGVTRHVRAWSQMARHQDGARPTEADPSPRHGVPGQSDRPVASSHNLCCTRKLILAHDMGSQGQQRHSPWYPAHACTHEGECTILEAMRAWIKKFGVSWYTPPPSRVVRTFARPPPQFGRSLTGSNSQAHSRARTASHFDKFLPLPSNTQQTPSSREAHVKLLVLVRTSLKQNAGK